MRKAVALFISLLVMVSFCSAFCLLQRPVATSHSCHDQPQKPEPRKLHPCCDQAATPDKVKILLTVEQAPMVLRPGSTAHEPVARHVPEPFNHRLKNRDRLAELSILRV